VQNVILHVVPEGIHHDSYIQDLKVDRDNKLQVPTLTVSAVDMDETRWNFVFLETDDCLLSTESLKEHSLLDMDRQSFLGAWRRKCKHGTCSASVSLRHKTKTIKRCVKEG